MSRLKRLRYSSFGSLPLRIKIDSALRRECLDHVIIFDEASLRRTLRLYFRYYHESRLHLSLDRDSTQLTPGTVAPQSNCDSRSRRSPSSLRTAGCVIRSGV